MVKGSFMLFIIAHLKFNTASAISDTPCGGGGASDNDSPFLSPFFFFPIPSFSFVFTEIQ